MKLLLFILGVIFFFILYSFYIAGGVEKTLVWNVFIEANIYVLVSIFIIGYVWRQEKYHHKQVQGDDIKEKKSLIQSIPFRKIIKKLFENYVYVVAIILFYFSSFLLLNTLFEEIALSEIFLVFNLWVLFLYFMGGNIKVFQDFLRVNTSVISLYYILYHIAYIAGISPWFSIIDLVNIIILWLLFFLFIRFSRQEQHLPEFFTYVLIFLYLEMIVICMYIFGFTTFVSIFILFLWALLFLLYTSGVSKVISLNKKYIRIWGLFSWYVCIILSLIFTIQVSILSFLVAFMIIVLSYIFYIFHNYFENYISLIFSFFWILIACYIFFSSMWLPYFYMSLFFFILSAFFLIADGFLDDVHDYDSYFFHIFSLLVNLVWCILFFLFWELSILSLSLLLMWESLYLFLSYYTLPKKIETL